MGSVVSRSMTIATQENATPETPPIAEVGQAAVVSSNSNEGDDVVINVVFDGMRCEASLPSADSPAIAEDTLPADTQPVAPQAQYVGAVAAQGESTDNDPPDARPEGAAPSVSKTASSKESEKSMAKSNSTETDKVTPSTEDASAKMKALPSRPSGSSGSSGSSDSMLSLGQRVRTGSKDIEDEVKNIASFEGCEELLRGSHLSVILRNQARIFSASNGDGSTYALSKQVKFIDAFISHNWSVSRWHKWLCLSLHFNLRKTLPLTFVVVSPLGIVAAYGWVPTVHPAFAPYPRSYVFRLVLYPVWLALLCFYQDIFRCFPTWTPLVFLDKTCIHQEDRAIQRRGIEKLGAFLCYSKTMVICYTDVYLMKLWTVYEVASFMTLQSVEQMRVIPVVFPIVSIATMTSVWFAGALGLWPELMLGFYYTMHIFLMALCYVVILAFRRWSRGKVAIYRRMADFTARNCTCFCENDRPLVYANIAALMRETQPIGKDASEDAALTCFDQLVRNHLCDALIQSVGKYGMRYEHAAGIGCAFFGPVLDQLVGLAHGMSWRELCSYALWYAFISLVTFPTGVMGIAAWAEQCLHIAGWYDRVFLALGVIVVFTMTAVQRFSCDLMEMWANESNIGLAVFALYVVGCSVISRNAMDGGPGFRRSIASRAVDRLAAIEGVDKTKLSEAGEANTLDAQPPSVQSDPGKTK